MGEGIGGEFQLFGLLIWRKEIIKMLLAHDLFGLKIKDRFHGGTGVGI